MTERRNICIGLMAHVDSGKTTLSEAILYNAGKLRKLGRVDKKDAFLDNFAVERERGITVFSKQAVFSFGNTDFTLVDTPGHVDFSPEMERTMSVLDVCVLVVSGPDGIQAHTRTLWKLLKTYDVPTFIFVNKMDRDISDRTAVMRDLKKQFGDGCVDLTESGEKLYEEISMTDEEVLESFLENGVISDDEIRDLIGIRKLFPVYFGSALKNDGVDMLLEGLDRYFPSLLRNEEFGARIYKTGRDSDGKRLTYLKLTGGKISVKDQITYCVADDAISDDSGSMTGNGQPGTGADLSGANDVQDYTENRTLTEKINEIRIYDGAKYITTDTAVQGMLVAVTGLTATRPGMVLGADEALQESVLTPVLEYRVAENDKSRLRAMLPRFRQLEEEEPQLHVYWNSQLKELQVRIMGQVQLEILKSRYKELFGEDISFDRGSILYRETVTEPVLGIGHYEPLRHYAEVQIIVEPAAAGSGVSFESACSVNELEKNWQRLICTHIFERKHKGTMIGAPLDDCRITLVAGRSHIKHTEGGDFRQATYRAVRQALMRARSEGKTRILEPYYDMLIEIPRSMIGRAMTDIEMRFGKITGQYESSSVTASGSADENVILTAYAPVSTVQDYSAVVTDYSGGLGSVYNTFSGYGPCHNEAEVMIKQPYDPENDMRNPSFSVFCAHGSGFAVPWNEVDNFKHISCDISFSESSWSLKSKRIAGEKNTEELLENLNTSLNSAEMKDSREKDLFVSTEEIDSILAGVLYANRKTSVKNPYRKHKIESSDRTAGLSTRVTKSVNAEQKEKYLLVDGYNIIFTWPELAELAKENIDSARDSLNDILMNYQATKKCKLIVVYDAYRVAGHQTECSVLNNICVVFTKEAETADRFIEKFAHDNAKQYDITVATSDGLEQIIIRGQGAALMTAMDLKADVGYHLENTREIAERTGRGRLSYTVGRPNE